MVTNERVQWPGCRRKNPTMNTSLSLVNPILLAASRRRRIMTKGTCEGEREQHGLFFKPAAAATAGDDEAAGTEETNTTSANNAASDVRTEGRGHQNNQLPDGDAQHDASARASLRVQRNCAIYCNVRGLWLSSNKTKVNYLGDTALESNAPFILLTETHLKPEILDAEVKIEGYSLYRADRGPEKTNGGVAVYLRHNLIGQLVVSHSNSMCETLAIKVKSLNMLLICLYRPPNSTIDNFRESINVCHKAIDDVTDADTKSKISCNLVILICHASTGRVVKSLKSLYHKSHKKSSKPKSL